MAVVVVVVGVKHKDSYQRQLEWQHKLGPGCFGGRGGTVSGVVRPMVGGSSAGDCVRWGRKKRRRGAPKLLVLDWNCVLARYSLLQWE